MENQFYEPKYQIHPNGKSHDFSFEVFLIAQLQMRHVTQFTEIGWNYLLNGTGSGELPNGGYYATWVDPKSTDFTMNIVKISRAWSSRKGKGF